MLSSSTQSFHQTKYSQFISIVIGFAFVCLIHTAIIHSFILLFELSCRHSHCRLPIQRTHRNCNHRSESSSFLFSMRFYLFSFVSLLCVNFFSLHVFIVLSYTVSGDRINKFRAIWTTTTSSSTMMIWFHAIFITIGSSWWQFYFVTRAFPCHLLLLLFTINTHKSLWTIWIIIRV